MFELCKLIWDFVVLRDVAKKGQLNWRVWVYGFGFVLVEYGIALPAVLLYEKHPQYKPLFIGAIILVLINFVGAMCWAIRWRSRQTSSQ
ncbi:MAG: hypothetical protein WA700_10735 [Acidobacteriaceae bacterium]